MKNNLLAKPAIIAIVIMMVGLWLLANPVLVLAQEPTPSATTPEGQPTPTPTPSPQSGGGQEEAQGADETEEEDKGTGFAIVDDFLNSRIDMRTLLLGSAQPPTVEYPDFFSKLLALACLVCIVVGCYTTVTIYKDGEEEAEIRVWKALGPLIGWGVIGVICVGLPQFVQMSLEVVWVYFPQQLQETSTLLANLGWTAGNFDPDLGTTASAAAFLWSDSMIIPSLLWLLEITAPIVLVIGVFDALWRKFIGTHPNVLMQSMRLPIYWLCYYMGLQFYLHAFAATFSRPRDPGQFFLEGSALTLFLLILPALLAEGLHYVVFRGDRDKAKEEGKRKKEKATAQAEKKKAAEERQKRDDQATQDKAEAKASKEKEESERRKRQAEADASRARENADKQQTHANHLRQQAADLREKASRARDRNDTESAQRFEAEAEKIESQVSDAEHRAEEARNKADEAEQSLQAAQESEREAAAAADEAIDHGGVPEEAAAHPETAELLAQAELQSAQAELSSAEASSAASAEAGAAEAGAAAAVIV